MELKQLERAKNLYEDIVQLDKEIIELQKYGQSIANEETKCKLKLSFYAKETEEKLETVNENSFQSIFTFTWAGQTRESKPKKNNENTVSIKDEIFCLKVISLLLEEKEQKRRVFMDRLSKLGIKI